MLVPSRSSPPRFSTTRRNSSCIARSLLARRTKGWESVVPMKLISGVVPAFPSRPQASLEPGSPFEPRGPAAPVAPTLPGSPLSPFGPLAPTEPLGPASPGSPFSPFSPLEPGAPAGPRFPERAYCATGVEWIALSRFQRLERADSGGRPDGYLQPTRAAGRMRPRQNRGLQ